MGARRISAESMAMSKASSPPTAAKGMMSASSFAAMRTKSGCSDQNRRYSSPLRLLTCVDRRRVNPCPSKLQNPSENQAPGVRCVLRHLTALHLQHLLRLSRMKLDAN